MTTEKTLAAVGRRPAFGINLDPSHFAHQHLDTAQFALEFADRIYHVHVKDSKKRLDGRRSILGSHVNLGEEARGWDFVSPGHGDVDFEALFRAPNRIGYALQIVGQALVEFGLVELGRQVAWIHLVRRLTGVLPLQVSQRSLDPGALGS